MTSQADPVDPQLAKWPAEGVTVEAHTATHPCPCLQGSELAKAKQTYDDAIDLLARIPGGPAIAFRMPCCDSMNSVGPRFFTEMFGKTTAAGHFLRVDSSVFMAFTADDPALPRSLTTDEEGRPRFTKYIPRDRNFVNYVENYPYPYVVDHLCWEMPSEIPDDWLGINFQGNHNPLTIRDMQAAIDAVVLKQGTFTLTFHPDRWIRNDQVIELIDHATSRYGNKVKFLNFREVHERLTKNLLGGQPLRADDGSDNGVRVLDLNHDGYMDVVIGNDQVRQTRIWSPQTRTWTVGDFPVQIVSVDAEGKRSLTGVRFGVLQKNGHASILVRNEQLAGLWHFDGRGWTAVAEGLKGLELNGPVLTASAGSDQGVRFCDLDLDGICELVVGNPRQNGVFQWSADGGSWTRLPFGLPAGTAIVDQAGRDAGLRLVDIDEDGSCRRGLLRRAAVQPAPVQLDDRRLVAQDPRRRPSAGRRDPDDRARRRHQQRHVVPLPAPVRAKRGHRQPLAQSHRHPLVHPVAGERSRARVPSINTARTGSDVAGIPVTRRTRRFPFLRRSCPPARRPGSGGRTARR